MAEHGRNGWKRDAGGGRRDAVGVAQARGGGLGVLDAGRCHECPDMAGGGGAGEGPQTDIDPAWDAPGMAKAVRQVELERRPECRRS